MIQNWLRDGRIALSIGSLAIGVGLGSTIAPLFYHQVTPRDVREFNSTYHFISPLLACSSDEDIGIDEARSLEKAIVDSIHSHQNAGDVSVVSVYYRDLNNGPHVGVDTQETFPPGSLLKVPLAMSVYKLSEDDPKLLDKQLVYTDTQGRDDQYFKPAPFSDGTYSIRDLVKQMLVNSDNTAASVLAHEVGASSFEATYQHLGIPQPPVEGYDYEITTSQFASFFRALYGATYLDDESSEDLLKLMSESAFTEGLVAGVPAGTVVSHKFGERAFSDNLTKELHDCGIVYVPKHPYLICIMTKGGDFKTLARIIAEISRLTYNFTTAL